MRTTPEGVWRRKVEFPYGLGLPEDTLVATPFITTVLQEEPYLGAETCL
jgi:hypothetical protein